MLVLATPINKGPFVISGGFQFIDTYLASRASGIRVRGVIFAPEDLTELEAILVLSIKIRTFQKEIVVF